MRLEALLASAAVVVLLATVGVAALVSGFVADPGPDEPPARLDVAETTLAAGDVTGETATLDVTTYVSHRGGPAENVTVVVRATDAESGLVADSTTRELGTVRNDGEREVSLSVTVPREGGYEVATILYVDGQRVDMATASVSGVGALKPPRVRTSVAFHEFPDRPSVEYRIASADGDRVTLDVTSYLTNGGDDPESGLRLVVTARHADAYVVADRAETTVGTVDPGLTVSPEVQVSVPDDNNYYLDVTLWRDGVILESTRAAANLDPQETISVNETRREVEFEAGDFETGDGSGGRPPRETEAGAQRQPGFGVGVALVALCGSLLAARRWSA
ncbi:MAG: PGF-CTERM protein [Natronomonas sp.]|jgi:PGF-CTERM protein